MTGGGPMPELTVAIVEDQREIREGLRALIDGTGGFRCVGAYRSMEEALERMPLPPAARSVEEKLARLDAILARGRGLPGMTMAEFDALEYDENGLPA